MPGLTLAVNSGPSMPKIIAHYQGEDEPRRSDRALQRTADLRFPNSRIIAHRHLYDAESPRAYLLELFQPPSRMFSPGVQAGEGHLLARRGTARGR